MEEYKNLEASTDEDAIEKYLLRSLNDGVPKKHEKKPVATDAPASTSASTRNAEPKKNKLDLRHMSFKQIIKQVWTSILEWIDTLPDRLARTILYGLVTAILLNVVTKFFWPELPEKIPTIYEFFNGFLVIAEFCYKTALGGIASIFTGTFLQFCDSITVEIGEMWNSFLTWMSSISF